MFTISSHKLITEAPMTSSNQPQYEIICQTLQCNQIHICPKYHHHTQHKALRWCRNCSQLLLLYWYIDFTGHNDCIDSHYSRHYNEIFHNLPKKLIWRYIWQSNKTKLIFWVDFILRELTEALSNYLNSMNRVIFHETSNFPIEKR